MRQRSNLIILFGIAFFIVGGAIAYLVLNDDDDGSGGSSEIAQVNVFVATQDIEANTLASDVVEAGGFTTQQVDSGTQPVGAITSAADLENRIFAVSVSEGDVISTSQLGTRSLSNISVPEGYDGVAVTIEFTNAGAGYIAPGDRVNVYGIYGSEGATGDAGLSLAEVAPDQALTPRAELALTNVLVLDVSKQDPLSTQPADPETGEQTATGREASGEPRTFLLALKPTDAERVALLATFADIYLSLVADDAPNAPDTPGYSGENVNGPVGTDSAFQPES